MPHKSWRSVLYAGGVLQSNAQMSSSSKEKNTYRLEIDSNKKHSVNMTPLLNVAGSFYAFYQRVSVFCHFCPLL